VSYLRGNTRLTELREAHDMRIGIISDTHDSAEAVRAALAQLRRAGAELLLHCGDITTPDTVRLFTGVPTHFVFGNWDGDGFTQRTRDPARLRRAIADVGGTVHEPFGHLTLAGREVGWVHGHDSALLQELKTCDLFDFVFYGHTHLPEQHRQGRTLVANPGALFRTATKQCAVLDVASGALEWLTVA
jgi:putative phosphoesterase